MQYPTLFPVSDLTVLADEEELFVGVDPVVGTMLEVSNIYYEASAAISLRDTDTGASIPIAAVSGNGMLVSLGHQLVGTLAIVITNTSGSDAYYGYDGVMIKEPV